jgi:nickel transport protein
MPAEVLPIMSCRPIFGGLNVLALVLTPVLAPVPAGAHGAQVEAEVVRNVEVSHRVDVRATYHSGRPMAGAGVSVFAPGDAETPWLTGACDDSGGFSFEPPPEMSGEWVVRVVHQGHGGVVTIGIEAAAAGDGAVPDPAVIRAEASSSPHLSTLQRVLMGACVVWGLVGTALFFSRRRA